MAHVSGFELYGSPEFQALCKRFGIAYGLLTRKMTIEITEDDVVVTQSYGADPTSANAVDTTSLHSKTYRTKEPRRAPKPDEPAERTG